MSPYIAKAVKVLSDPEQTSTAKQMAMELLRNAGLSECDIRAIETVETSADFDPSEQFYIFYA